MQCEVIGSFLQVRGLVHTIASRALPTEQEIEFPNADETWKMFWMNMIEKAPTPPADPARFHFER